MATVTLEDTTLTNIGNSIRGKLGTGTLYLPQEMPNAILSIPVTPPFDWGSEAQDGSGTAEWWANLKEWIGSANTGELAACVGKTKSVTLTRPVLGTTTHLVRCIGYNVHRDKNNPTRNTLTFETKNTLPTYNRFSKSEGIIWPNSEARNSICANYYAYFPGKQSICTVSLGTAKIEDSNQNAAVSYTNETVFLLSDAEHGLIAGYNQDEKTGYAASYNEFDQYNTSKTVPQYYSDTTKAIRIKFKGDSSTVGVNYWERSFSYDSIKRICIISGGGTSFIYDPTGRGGYAPAFVI